MKRIVPIIIILAAIGGGYWWYTQSNVAALETGPEAAALVGSGTIEAETIAITAELGGRVLEVKVDEGDEVTAGQVLVELDKSDLLAQQAQLEAAVATAKANLELASASARPEEIAAAQAQLAQAEVARDGAGLIAERAKALVNNPHELEARVNQAQAQVSEAEKSLELAQVNLKRMEIQAEAAGRNQSNHAALVESEAAQKRLEAARIGVQMAQVALEGAKKQVEHLTRLRLMPLSLIAQANAAEAAFGQAQAAVLAAQANLAAVKADPTPEDIAIAQAQLGEAEAGLELVAVQLDKQTLTAPRDGLISQKLIEPGELAAPGTMLLELSDIRTVDLTVYIPETRIGQVKIGQKARVYVDAYAGDVFEGVVTFISHEAEFTPRNVQTREERVNLVFAVKITLDNAGHRLKPGMPADAEILPEMAAAATQTPLPTARPTATLPPTATQAPTQTPAAALPTATSAAAATASPAASGTAAAGRVKVMAWALKVRRGPGIGYESVAHLSQGDVVPVLKVDPVSGWLQVELPGGETGWITGSSTYVLPVE